MSEVVIPRRLASQPRALYFRSEKAGLTLENQPVPWCAEAIIVEALLRLPPVARKRGDFVLRVPGQASIVADILRMDEAGQRHRLYFRFPVPKNSVCVELHWRNHELGRLEIPVVTQDQFLSGLKLHLPTVFVNVEGRGVAASTFVASQQRGLSATALLQSPTGLLPLLDLGLTATFRSLKTNRPTVVPVPLTAGQLLDREALVAAMPPRMPRSSGDWTVTWTCPGRELGISRLRAITPREFHASLRVSDTRFGIVTEEGTFRVVRTMPAEGVAKAAPCFLVASHEAGMAGLAQFEISVQVPGAEGAPRTVQQAVLITDGPTPVVTGLFPMDELKPASAFELRLNGRVLGILPLSPVPAATLTAEGGFKPPPEFTWSATAEDELSDRLARLMGLPPDS